MVNAQQGTKMTRSKGYALVKGSKVTVMAGMGINAVMEHQRRANRFNPLERVQIAECTFIYEGMGKYSDVKIGRFIA